MQYRVTTAKAGITQSRVSKPFRWRINAAISDDWRRGPASKWEHSIALVIPTSKWNYFFETTSLASEHGIMHQLIFCSDTISSSNIYKIIDCIIDHDTSSIILRMLNELIVFESNYQWINNSKSNGMNGNSEKIFHLLVGVASEIECSHFEAGPRCLQSSAMAALVLHQNGLDTRDCVVPALMCNGDSIQVYLIPTSYPVLVKLTRDLDFFNYIDRLLFLTRWTVHVCIQRIETCTRLEPGHSCMTAFCDTMIDCVPWRFCV